MFSRLAVFLALVASADASAKQKLVKGARRLNDEVDMSWMPNYSIKFQKCHSLMQVAGEEGGGGGEEESMLYQQHLVEFSLCPSDTCTDGAGCSDGAKYIIGMQQFVQLYTEMKQEEKEQACEAVRENCNNDDENACYANAGMDYCIEEEDGQEEEDMERYMECQALENDGNNNNYNYQDGYYREFFVGPYCSENQMKIHLGVFVDAGCSIKAEEGVYEGMNYGRSLPYSSSSMVDMDCISCEMIDYDNNNNNNNNNGNNNNNNNGDVELNQICEETYEQAGRCEKKLDGVVSYPDTTSCDFIESILPKLDRANQNLSFRSGAGGASVGFAWAFGILAAVLGVYSFLLYRRLRRSKVALNPDAPATPANGTIA